MRRFVGLLSGLILVASVVPARAMNWSLGANLGLEVTMFDDDTIENSTEFSWPTSSMGMRVGFAGENPRHEVYVATGLSLFSQDPLSLRFFQATGNYQYNFGSSGSVAPYLTGGAGLVSVGADVGSSFGELSAISGVFGGGVGVRHKMGNGHGTLRAEARYDLVTEGEDESVIVIDKAGIFGVRMGFDLWDK